VRRGHQSAPCGLGPLCALLTSGLAMLGCGGTAHTDNTGTGDVNCPDIPRVNVGATTGTLIIHGHITDASGAAVVGGRIDLSGGASAVRYSDFTGGFIFHVSPGSYTLKASGDCTLTPSSTPVSNLTADATYDFAATDDGCVSSVPTSAVASGSVLSLSQSGTEIARPGASVRVDSSPAAAQSDLRTIAGEGPVPPCSLLIDGNPAIERQRTATIPGPLDGADITQLNLTTAIAVGSTIVRFETALAEGSEPVTVPPIDTIDRILAAGRDFTAEELPELHSP
jgi:hypothetical protein